MNLGCGTCEVPKALAERWRKRQRLRVLSVDNSKGCVAKSRGAQGAGTVHCALDFAVEDALMLRSVPDRSVDICFDKGLIDALHPRDDAASRATMSQLFATVRRVLKPGGRFVVVSMVQSHVRALLSREAQGWGVCAAPAAPASSEAALVPICLRFAPDDPALAVSDDATSSGACVDTWLSLWRQVDARIAARRPPDAKPERVRVVELTFGLRGRRNGLEAAEKVAARLGGVEGVRWARPPAPEPLAFGVHAVGAAAIVGEDSDADAVRGLLGEALRCEAVDDDASAASSESSDDDSASPLRVAWPEIIGVSSGQVST